MSDLKMPSVNSVFLAGRLTRDPELKYTTQGKAVCKLGLAVSLFSKGQDGERKEDTLFIDVTVWEKTAEYCGERLRKGRPILVEGRLKSDAWEDKTTGQKRTKIVVTASRIHELDWEDRSGGPPKPAPREIEEPIPEDDVPF